MRALLVANPKATTVSGRAHDVISRALSSEVKLDSHRTRYRGHATALARQAGTEGYGLVIALGGDGTVNEVVNGLISCAPTMTERPALAVVPGGDANVFARTIGLPSDPIEATGTLLNALHGGSTRTLGLGCAGDRFFTFCAGLGLDAEVIRAVEGLRAAGRRSTPTLYARTAIRHYLSVTDRRRPALRLVLPAGEAAQSIDEIFCGIVSNTSPWTYLGDYAANPSPYADFDSGLDLFALRSLRILGTMNQLRQLLTPDGKPNRGRHTVARHDLAEFTLIASRPVAFQIDGDYLGERERVHFRAAPAALRVYSGASDLA